MKTKNIFIMVAALLLTANMALAQNYYSTSKGHKSKKSHVASIKKPKAKVHHDRYSDSYASRVAKSKKKNSSRVAHGVKPKSSHYSKFSHSKQPSYRSHQVAKNHHVVVKKGAKTKRQATQHKSWE